MPRHGRNSRSWKAGSRRSRRCFGGAEVVATPHADDAIQMGSSVTVEADGEQVTYVLVSPSEVDLGGGRISVASPVGRALLGHGPGDEVMIRTPQGEAHYRVVSVG